MRQTVVLLAIAERQGKNHDNHNAATSQAIKTVGQLTALERPAQQVQPEVEQCFTLARSSDTQVDSAPPGNAIMGVMPQQLQSAKLRS